MRAILAVLVLVVVAFAGCAADPKNDKEADPTASGTETGSGTKSGTSSSTKSSSGSTSQSGTGFPSANHAPAATLTANRTAGTAPLSVNFTLGGTDADNDSLSWTLSFGDGSANATGSTLPSTVVHAFAAAGNYTVLLTVRDARSNDTANVTVRATAASGSGGGEPIHREGSVTALCVHCAGIGPSGCISMAIGESGLDCYMADLPAEAVGRVATLASSNGFINYGFYDECSASGTLLEGSADNDSPFVTTVPAGATCVAFFEYLDFPFIDYTVDIA
ncbi:MAG: PKD domain-containing protein [Candidatus Thermoplasmatota archaeon]